MTPFRFVYLADCQLGGYPLGNDPSGLRVGEVAADGVRHHYLALRAGERVV